MNTLDNKFTRLGLLLLLFLFASSSMSIYAEEKANILEDPMVSLFQASLMGDVQGMLEKKGSVLVTFEANTLQMVGFFNNFTSPWIQIDLYRDDPVTIGEHIRNIAITVPEGGGYSGGIEATVILSEAEVTELFDGRFYINVRSLGDRSEDLIGQVQPWSVEDPLLMKTDFWHFQRGALARSGSVQAVLEEGNLRLIGYGTLGAPINQVNLLRGASGSQGELVAIILFNFSNTLGSLAGFDHVLPLSDSLIQDMHDGLLSLEINTFGFATSYGRLLLSTNQPPEAAQLTGPADGATLVIGGSAGEAPIDLESQLAEIVFSSAIDPDGQPVEYIWQVSRSQDFSASVSVVIPRGLDSSPFPLTVAAATVVFDTTWSMLPGPLPLQTPVQYYHRMITSDGARYTYGPPVSLMLVRGTITANETENDLPTQFTLHGNYPNPFNPSTTITFDLPWRAEVQAEVFDLIGRQVLIQKPGMLAAGANQMIEIDGSTLPSGTYLYRVAAENEQGAQMVTGRMVLIK